MTRPPRAVTRGIGAFIVLLALVPTAADAKTRGQDRFGRLAWQFARIAGMTSERSGDVVTLHFAGRRDRPPGWDDPQRAVGQPWPGRGHGHPRPGCPCARNQTGQSRVAGRVRPGARAVGRNRSGRLAAGPPCSAPPGRRRTGARAAIRARPGRSRCSPPMGRQSRPRWRLPLRRRPSRRAWQVRPLLLLSGLLRGLQPSGAMRSAWVVFDQPRAIDPEAGRRAPRLRRGGGSGAAAGDGAAQFPSRTARKRICSAVHRVGRSSSRTMASQPRPSRRRSKEARCCFMRPALAASSWCRMAKRAPTCWSAHWRADAAAVPVPYQTPGFTLLPTWQGCGDRPQIRPDGVA